MKLTVTESARRAGVSTGVVYAWIAAKLLPVYRLGMPGKRGKVLIEESDLEAFLASCKVAANGPERQDAVPARIPELKHLKL
jgi:excisionase family DNA binding protein